MGATRSTDPATMCCPPITHSPLTRADAAAASAFFSALADPVRLQLFSLVAAHGEVCSCNLEAPLGRSQPTVSHHTKVLAEAGLLKGERRGKWMWWTVLFVRNAPPEAERHRRTVGAARRDLSTMVGSVGRRLASPS